MPPVYLDHVPPPAFSDGTPATYPEIVAPEDIDMNAKKKPFERADAATYLVKNLTPTLKDLYKAFPAKCPGVPAGTTELHFSESAVCDRLPDGYMYVGQRRSDPSKKAIDFYLFGHPSGIKYRSWPEFQPHLEWLVTSETHQYAECACKPCASWARRTQNGTATPISRKRKQVNTPNTASPSSVTPSTADGTATKKRKSIIGDAARVESPSNGTPSAVVKKRLGKKTASKVITIDDDTPTVNEQQGLIAASTTSPSRLFKGKSNPLPSDSVMTNGARTPLPTTQSSSSSKISIGTPVEVPALNGFPRVQDTPLPGAKEIKPSIGMPVDVPALKGFPSAQAASANGQVPAVRSNNLKITPVGPDMQQLPAEKAPPPVAQPAPTGFVPQKIHVHNPAPIVKTPFLFRDGDIVWVLTYLMLSDTRPSVVVPIPLNPTAHRLDIQPLREDLTYWPAVIRSTHMSDEDVDAFKDVWVPPLFVGCKTGSEEMHVRPTHRYREIGGLPRWFGKGYKVRLIDLPVEAVVLEEHLVPFTGYMLPRSYRISTNILADLPKLTTDRLLYKFLQVVNKTYEFARSTLCIASSAPRIMTVPGQPGVVSWECIQMGAERIRVNDHIRVAQDGSAQVCLFQVERISWTRNEPMFLHCMPSEMVPVMTYEDRKSNMFHKKGDKALVVKRTAGARAMFIKPENIVGRFYRGLDDVNGWSGPRGPVEVKDRPMEIS